MILLGGQGAGGGGGRGADEFAQQAPVCRCPRGAQGGASRQPAPQDDYGQGITDDDVPF